jgi:hypothetical protein
VAVDVTLKSRLKRLDARVLGDPAREDPFPFAVPKFLAVVAAVCVALIVLREFAGSGVAGAVLIALFLVLNVIGERRRRHARTRPPEEGRDRNTAT